MHRENTDKINKGGYCMERVFPLEISLKMLFLFFLFFPPYHIKWKIYWKHNKRNERTLHKEFLRKEKKIQQQESQHPYTWVSTPCRSISLHHRRLNSPPLDAALQGQVHWAQTQWVGLLWKDQRWDMQGVKPGGGKSAPLIPFKILFSWKKIKITIFWSSPLSLN